VKLGKDFFCRDVLVVAPELLGKIIVRKFSDDSLKKFTITEVEAYRGEDDLACHASKGRTNRTEVMYWPGGFIYVYLIYGIHYLLNFVTAEIDKPQAVLIRGVDQIIGPGRVSKTLQIDKSLNKVSLFNSKNIWVEDANMNPLYTYAKRIGIEYSGEIWKNKPWRFILTKNL